MNESVWKPIETAPDGYDGKEFNYVLFRGYSKGRSFAHSVEVSGYMGVDNDGKRVPIHFYAYKLVITHWAPIPK